MTIFQLSNTLTFPPVERAEPNGLLAVGGDLRPERLLAAYRKGIFPWYNPGNPILWWFTAPRLVLLPEEFHIPKRVARYWRKSPIEIRYDTSFQNVIQSCATSRLQEGKSTWILPEMVTAYTHLHQLGYAHSVECWQEETLVGGLYGVELDTIFFGESMFSQVTHASKFALLALVKLFTHKKGRLIDCQMTTHHLQRFGAREISRRQFQHHLEQGITSLTPQPKWKSFSYTKQHLIVQKTTHQDQIQTKARSL